MGVGAAGRDEERRRRAVALGKRARLTPHELAELLRIAARGEHMGVGLVGKVLGSLGVGNIGAEMFRLAKPFDMHFIAHDPFIDSKVAAALGIALGLLAQVLGAALGFGWARLIGRGWAERRLAGRFGQRLRPLRDAIAEQPFGTTLALRLLPVGNNLALNLLAGMTGIAAAPFLAASALGYLPQTAIFALLGKGVRVDGAWQLVLAAAMLGLSVWLGFRLLRRHRAGRALAP
jgi:membrane protein DedA with SNARE-associated domain